MDELTQQPEATPEKLTTEQIDAINIEVEAKAKELSDQLKVEVHPLVFLIPGTNERVIGFIKEPNRVTKIRVMDKGLISPMTAAAELLEAVLIKEHSDPRIFSDSPEYDDIYMGAVMAAYETVKVGVNQFKKK